MSRRFEIDMVENGRPLHSSMVNSTYTIREVADFYGLYEDDIDSFTIRQYEDDKLVGTLNKGVKPINVSHSYKCSAKKFLNNL